MPPDIQKYMKHVEAFDITEAEKIELIHCVWSIMENGLDRALGVDSVQRCGIPDAQGDSRDVDPVVNSINTEDQT